MNDIINHPSHYTAAAVYFEPVDMTKHLPHPVASACEYLLRAGKKEGAPEDVDLKKASWWLNLCLNTPELWYMNALRGIESTPVGRKVCAIARCFAINNVYIDELFSGNCVPLGSPTAPITKASMQRCLRRIGKRLEEIQGVK